MRRNPHFPLKQSNSNRESKVSNSSEMNRNRKATESSKTLLHLDTFPSGVSSAGRVSSLFNEYALKTGDSPTIGVQQMNSSRDAQEFFLHCTLQPHDAHKEQTQYPTCIDSERFSTPYPVYDKINQHCAKRQFKGRSLRPTNESISSPLTSVLDELSEIKLPLGCSDSSSLPSETSLFSPLQTIIDSTGSMSPEGEGVNNGDSTSETKPPEEIRKAKERNKSQNQNFAAPAPTEKSSFPMRDQRNMKARPRQQPPAPYQEWIEGIVDVATCVWMPLGLFGFCPVGEPPPLSVVKEAVDESIKTVPDSKNEKEFLRRLQDFYTHVIQEAIYPYPEIVCITNGLWQLLFNTLFYCLSLHDFHQGSCASGRNSDDEVGEARAPGQPPFVVPVPLSWGGTPASRSQPSPSLRRRSEEWQQRQPASSGMYAAATKTPPGNRSRAQPTPAKAFGPKDLTRGDALGASDSSAVGDSYAARLGVPLSVLDWCLLVRCLAQLGYVRDQFYVQTPTQASPHELLLVMLWLTKQYQLISVAEYVEMNRRFPFLLRYHSVKSDDEGTPSFNMTLPMNQKRLLFSFSKSTAWPPASFDESATIAHRLCQIERVLGADRSERRIPSPVARETQHHAKGIGKIVLRRVLAAQNLIKMSLNRLEHALQQRNELVSAVGLHSYLDAQLCIYEHHNLYVKVIEGLSYLSVMEERIHQRSRSLRAVGLLLSFAIAHRDLPSHATDLDVVESLEEDADTWLAYKDDNDQNGSKRYGKTKTMSTSVRRFEAVRRGQLCDIALDQARVGEEKRCNTELLSHTVSQFRAARVKEHLSNEWKSVVRSAQINASPGISAPSSFRRDGSTVLLPDEAQDEIELHVQQHIDRHYSLHAALAAELLILQYQQQGQIYSLQDQKTFSASLSCIHGSSHFLEVQDSCVEPQGRGGETPALPLKASEVALVVPLFFTTATPTSSVDTSEEIVSMFNSSPLGDCDIQLVEIGDPGPGATTSATVEVERISRILEEMIQEFKKQQDTRVAYCRESLNRLSQDYNLRVLIKVGQE